jgi:hypothetical protein
LREGDGAVGDVLLGQGRERHIHASRIGLRLHTADDIVDDGQRIRRGGPQKVSAGGRLFLILAIDVTASALDRLGVSPIA